MTRKPLCIRSLCFLLALLLLCPMILPGLPARAASYNADKALAYAKAHWNDGRGCAPSLWPGAPSQAAPTSR